MSKRDFVEFCNSLVGTWVGHRDSDGLVGEKIRSVWKKALSGSFLHEEWFTSGKEGTLRHTATAYFRIATGAPAEFLVVYRGGAIAIGDSTFESGVWKLRHRWLESGGEATITLQLPDADTYRQDVMVRDDGSSPKLEGRTILTRVRE
jgi:hypothetical protein